jgi:NAD+ synthase (glutamine-hydrolysing)
LKIALGQINPTIGHFTGNIAKMLEYTALAQKENADVIAFPELAICGYPPRDLVDVSCFIQKNMAAAQTLAHNVPRDITVIAGLVTRPDLTDKCLNSAAIIRNGRIELIQSKMLLPTYDVFDEWRNFRGAESQQVFTLKHFNIGLCICEDMWNNHKFNLSQHIHDPYRIDPVTNLVRKGADIIIAINASPFNIGKTQVRDDLMMNIAREHELPVAWVNMVGGNDHLIFDGASAVWSGRGHIVGRARSFEEDLICYDTQTDESNFHWENRMRSNVADIYEALVLGTRDYVRKCGFSKVVIGLSGGIDSAVTAAIAVGALGAENVTGITMPSCYSSQGSIDDSTQLAKNLGIDFFIHPIDTMFGEYLRTANEAYEQPDFKPNFYAGICEENLQARIRGTILMAFSNKKGALVLSTGNKSELAVGYCTLYGDMCGGLAVISDVPKTMVYELANYINQHNTKRSFIPNNTITKPPSAELAPGQKDSDSLPPYEVLDQILHAYIEEVRCPEEIASNHEIPLETVVRVVKMIERNEYKRQQATIGLRVTAKAFGMGRRYPIARKLMV